MIAKVTAPDLAQDVAGAEVLLSRHQEHRAEIETRAESFTAFYATGNTLINQVNTFIFKYHWFIIFLHSIYVNKYIDLFFKCILIIY